MNPLLWFLFGWLTGSLIMAAIIVAYYFRARRRVASIKAAIAQYQSASKLVGGVADSVYGPLMTPMHRKIDEAKS